MQIHKKKGEKGHFPLLNCLKSCNNSYPHPPSALREGSVRNKANNSLRQPVQHQALLAGDATTFHVVLPGADLQQASIGTGIERFTSRLIQGRKAVLSDENQTIASVHGLAHHLLFAGSDGGAHQYAASLAAGQPLFAEVGILLVGIGAMDDDGDLLRDVKQETVSYQLAVPLGDVSIVQGGEEVGMQSLDSQTAGVIVEIVLPVGELPVVEED